MSWKSSGNDKPTFTNLYIYTVRDADTVREDMGIYVGLIAYNQLIRWGNWLSVYVFPNAGLKLYIFIYWKVLICSSFVYL